MNAKLDVATGTALATNMGSVSCSDYTIVGDTINTASRLQGKLAPSEMSVTAEGYQSISSFFPAAIRMEYLFRGPAQPVPAYRLARALSVIRQTATSDGQLNTMPRLVTPAALEAELSDSVNLVLGKEATDRTVHAELKLKIGTGDQL